MSHVSRLHRKIGTAALVLTAGIILCSLALPSAVSGKGWLDPCVYPAGVATSDPRLAPDFGRNPRDASYDKEVRLCQAGITGLRNLRAFPQEPRPREVYGTTAEGSAPAAEAQGARSEPSRRSRALVSLIPVYGPVDAIQGGAGESAAAADFFGIAAGLLFLLSRESFESSQDDYADAISRYDSATSYEDAVAAHDDMESARSSMDADRMFMQMSRVVGPVFLAYSAGVRMWYLHKLHGEKDAPVQGDGPDDERESSSRLGMRLKVRPDGTGVILGLRYGF